MPASLQFFGGIISIEKLTNAGCITVALPNMDEPYLLPLHVIFPLYELYYATFVFTTLQGLHEPAVCRQHVRIATILSGSLVDDILREQAKCAASCKTGTSVSSERRSSLEDRALGSLL